MKRGILTALLAIALTSLASLAHAQVADTIPPAIPSGVTATFAAPSTVTVTWSASTDNVGVVGYYVYRNGSILTSTGGTTIVDNVTPGVYSYAVAAYDAAGNVSLRSSQSAPVSAVADTTPPSAPVWGTITATTSSIALSWKASTDNVGVTGYYVYRNGQQIEISSTSAYTATSYTDSGLVPGQQYIYVIVAYDASGNEANSAQKYVTTLSDLSAPSTPYFIASPAVKSSSEIDVAWAPSYDNVAVAGYYVYQNGNQVGNVGATSTTYASTGLAASTNYTYAIAAYDAAGNVSQQSASEEAETQAPDTTPPTPPSNFKAIPSSSSVALSWNPSTDNVAVTGYYITQNGNQVANVAASTTSYVSGGLATDTVYIYFLNAYDAAANISASSTQAFVTTLASAPPTVAPSAASTPALIPTISAPTPTGTPVPATVVPPPTIAVVPTGISGATTFTALLYFGSRGTQVTALQKLLISQGDLGANYATGVFGALTQAALQKFQCAQAIVCSGSPWTNGYGLVGVRTRKALNAELQTLEAQLNASQGK